MTSTLTETASALTRIARLVNDEGLPPASITLSHNNQIVTVNATDTELPENTIRRWAQALGLIVHDRPVDFQQAAATYYAADGTLDGVYWTLFAFVPVEAAA